LTVKPVFENILVDIEVQGVQATEIVPTVTSENYIAGFSLKGKLASQWGQSNEEEGIRRRECGGGNKRGGGNGSEEEEGIRKRE
jgi:hypothetical protein